MAKKGASVNVLATVKYKIISNELKLHYKFKTPKAAMLLLFLIDSSGSMVQNRQIATAKGVVEDTLRKSPYKKVMFALVAIIGGEACVKCNPTYDSSLIMSSLLSLGTGGKTAMGEGLLRTKEVINTYLQSIKNGVVQLFIFTDGKFNKGGNNPFEEAVKYYQESINGLSSKTMVVDTETGFVKLEMAKKFADAIAADYRKVSRLTD